MKKSSGGSAIGRPEESARNTWVQTPRATHEAWMRLSIKKPRAAALLHLLVSKMGQRNAVVISQAILAQLMGVTDRTIRTCISDLVAGRWLEVVRLGKGRESAYVINDRVAWAERRENLRLSTFSATVVADWADQDPDQISGPALRQIPVLFPDEIQLPSGPAEDPPAQPALEGMTADLPARQFPEGLRIGETMDKLTGEILAKAKARKGGGI